MVFVCRVGEDVLGPRCAATRRRPTATAEVRLRLTDVTSVPGGNGHVHPHGSGRGNGNGHGGELLAEPRRERGSASRGRACRLLGSLLLLPLAAAAADSVPARDDLEKFEWALDRNRAHRTPPAAASA